jgi:RNA polymerase sigma-70 factor (ECF subfamily)
LSKGDRTAANALVERYYDEIYRYAYRQSESRTASMEQAEDLTQEIFISALRSLPTFDRGKASFRTWLYKIASSRIIDAHRKFRPFEVQIDETEIAGNTDIAEETQKRDLLQRIEEHISALPSETQRILRLHLYGDMTFAEIGKAMGLREATVKTKFYRAVQKIKEEFHGEYED